MMGRLYDDYKHPGPWDKNLPPDLIPPIKHLRKIFDEIISPTAGLLKDSAITSFIRTSPIRRSGNMWTRSNNSR